MATEPTRPDVPACAAGPLARGRFVVTELADLVRELRAAGRARRRVRDERKTA